MQQPHHLQQADRYVERLVQARTSVLSPYHWGVSELRFNRDLAQQAQIGLISVAGGGDTVAALNKAGAADAFSYISTAGGAFLEWMEGKELPGVAALADETE